MSTLKSEILMAIGEASMCWTPAPKGVFDSSQAALVADKLHGKFLERYRDMARMLERLQWIATAYGFAGDTCPRCPICDGLPDGASLDMGAGSHEHGRGHMPECELWKLIKEPGDGN
jgi:hypothetical protein